MTTSYIYPNDYSVYPGQYIPLPEKEALFSELKASCNETTAQPLVNMDEFEDCFKIEVIIPGIKKEDIFSFVENNVLSIIVLPKSSEHFKTEKLQIHEFDTECLQRHILLPGNADAEFVSAEYKDGILSIYISKSREASKTYTQQIMVY